MNGELIIVLDLGHFKAYRIIRNPYESPRLELIESFDTIDAHSKMSDMVTDRAGRFGMGGEKNSLKGYGEPHNLITETEKRLIKEFTKKINTLIVKEDCSKWHLAASKKINNQILSSLDPAVKGRLGRNLASDLTKADKSELLNYFA